MDILIMCIGYYLSRITFNLVREEIIWFFFSIQNIKQNIVYYMIISIIELLQVRRRN